MKVFAALGAAIGIVCVSVPAIAYRSMTGVTRVAIYRGPAACEDCAEAMARSISKLGSRYQVTFVGPGEWRDVTPSTLRHFQVYIQPGGGQDIDAALASLGSNRVGAIRQFVAQGGGYVGVCMGAYLADASNIGLIDDHLDSEVGRPGFSVRTTADSAVPVHWQSGERILYYQDGPYLHAQPRSGGYRTIATYGSGDVAAARYSVGRGSVVLSGPHPEADASWFDDAGLPTSKQPTGTPIKELIDQLKA